MRVKNYFFLHAVTYTGSGALSSFGVTGSNTDIGPSNVTFQSAAARQDNSDGDPYGNVELFIDDMTVTAGSVAVTFGKSGITGSTTDSIDVIILSARK